MRKTNEVKNRGAEKISKYYRLKDGGKKRKSARVDGPSEKNTSGRGYRHTGEKGKFGQKENERLQKHGRGVPGKGKKRTPMLRKVGSQAQNGVGTD